jgi:hypothetical protein
MCSNEGKLQMEEKFGSYASLLIQATDQRRSKKPFGLQSTAARFQRKCFFPLSANLRKIQSLAACTRKIGRSRSEKRRILLRKRLEITRKIGRHVVTDMKVWPSFEGTKMLYVRKETWIKEK